MKKLILTTALIVVTAVAVSLSVYSNRADKNLLLSANIEALTQIELLHPSEYDQDWSGLTGKLIASVVPQEEPLPSKSIGTQEYLQMYMAAP